ncbi:unnamed protein product [Rhizoctonia solani]|uniref:Zn(2)-C6 fungal-type domain-containing protein n=1 Tax=Rhizoctonia solani TaxID=456999 RepID=A0A8H3I5G6_9AGAM|nr:unnamed protein product [Rhizoctonia solani]
MSRVMVIPKRSIGGCLTCKRRKKKCDEQKPRCKRCVQGDFRCLGYGSLEDGYVTKPSNDTEVGFFDRALYAPHVRDGCDSPSSMSQDYLIQRANTAEQSHQIRILQQQLRASQFTIPKSPSIDPLMLENATSLIMSQFLHLSQELLFKPPSVPFEAGLLWRIGYSDFTRWSMYLTARVLKDMSSGINSQKYLGWIFRFCQRILESHTSREPAIVTEGRLGGLHDLTQLGFTVSGISFGYSLFQRSTPTFLRLAALEPNLWSDNSNILISKAIRSRYEVSRFVAHDTLIALILGVPPLLHYDTTAPWSDEQSNRVIELIYGIPIEVLYLLAKINARRVARLMGDMVQSQNEWRDIERSLKNGSSTIDHTDDPIKDITRFAVQETWRQATLIYCYMGVKDVNSADPRVEAAVQQVVQLGSTIEPGSALELHTLIPCVIAGAAARQEKHRASLRSKIASRSSRREIILVLRAAEFAAVLDHLWHGAGADGKPTTWEDYVHSRCAVIPITS